MSSEERWIWLLGQRHVSFNFLERTVTAVSVCQPAGFLRFNAGRAGTLSVSDVSNNVLIFASRYQNDSSGNTTAAVETSSQCVVAQVLAGFRMLFWQRAGCN